MNSIRIPGHQILDWQQTIALLDNKETLLSGGNAIRSKVNTVEVSWEEASDFYNSQSTSDRAMIRKSGQQGGLGWWDPVTESLTDNPTQQRGILLCQMYLKQDRKCAYTLTGPHHILDLQVEHITPNGGDHPDNMILTLYNVNENRCQSTMEVFVDRWQKRADKGEREFTSWYADMLKASAKGQKEKVKILAMDEEDLAKFAPMCAKRYEKYMWRNIGMSSIQPFRLTKKGEVRSGGSQGNYKPVLNTILHEHLYGDKELAQQMFHTIRVAASNYVNGKINNDTYASIMCDCLDLSNHQPVGYNRDKFIANVLRNTYSWSHLKK